MCVLGYSETAHWVFSSAYVCVKRLCISVCVSVAARRCSGCFPLCVLGARIGLSVTVKWEGVGDDRCRGGGKKE